MSFSMKGVFLAGCFIASGYAQLAPTGAHYAGRASDTGFGGSRVTAAGTFGAEVPLDLPPARGGYAVPLQIVYGSGGVGAAGASWHIPLNYIARNHVFAYRRPLMRPGALPTPRERVTLSLFGQTQELIPRGSDWVARVGTLELVVRQAAASWQAYDGMGRTYTFECPAVLASTGMCLLKYISAPGGDTLELTYQIVTWPLNGGVGQAIDVIRIDYNKHLSQGCFKNEIALSYGNGSIAPVSLSVLGNTVLVRKNTLTAVDVTARVNCTSVYQRLRRYTFDYAADTDTHLPRLRAVSVLGQQGTPEAAVALPLVTYGYGSATENGALHFQKTQVITVPAGVALDQIAGTALDSSVNAPVSGDRYAMWQTLIDVTGDGRPDLVFPKNGKLWVAYNQPGAGGTTTIGAGQQAIASLSDATFANGSFSTHTTAKRRFAYLPANRNTTDVWRQAIDINGDGRVDIIDAAEQSDHWVVYLNTPGGPTGVKWQRRSFSVTALRAMLSSSGHWIDGPYVPLSRRATGADVKGYDCWRWDGVRWNWYPQGFSNGRCVGSEQQVTDRGSETTFIEWELADLNGDGYPDFVFNSSPVDFQPSIPPDNLHPVVGAVYPTDFGVGGTFWHRFSPGAANEVRASFNVVGVRFDTNTQAFAQSVTLLAQSPAVGVGQWICPGASFGIRCTDTSAQIEFAGLEDVNGDGLVDRVVGNHAYLGMYAGTAITFSPVYITLPGPVASQRSTYDKECSTTGNHHPTTTQTRGLRDLTGDGIPDYFDNGRLWIGTGTGFRDSIDIVTAGADFAFSHETESCDGKTSNTDGGLYDIDGDGRPEVVGLVGNTYWVSQVTKGQAVGVPDSGRLTEIGNGYGATTQVSYISAKQFTDNAVPFPEVVVSSVSTAGAQNLGGRLNGSRFAYSNAELIFDSALDRFSFRGYGRKVELPLLDGPSNSSVGNVSRPYGGNAIIEDLWPLTPFSVALTKVQRWQRLQRAGQVRDVFRMRDVGSTDPWALLNLSASDPRLIGAAHYEWDAKYFEEPASPGENAIDCLDMVAPLDLATSFADNLGANGMNACRAHGFGFASSSTTWFGGSPPPSDNNIQTSTRTLALDDFGRTTSAAFDNDIFRGDDDICVENRYAAPTGSVPRVLNALASRQLSDCKTSATVASESYAYDGLPAGSVSLGRVTSHSVDRRSTDNGALLNTVRVFDAQYDVFGNPTLVSTQRGGDTRMLQLDYDEFGLAPVHTRIQATNVPSIDSTVEWDPLSLRRLGTTDANHIRRGTEFDGFGRPVRRTVTPPGGSLGVIAAESYFGFEAPDPQGRRVLTTWFDLPVPPAKVTTAKSRTETVFLDELGRSYRRELALGSDYANQILVAGARTYDGANRVVFETDPYPKNQASSTNYGTTYYFSNTGDLSCWIRGAGPQAFTMVSDVASERFPTCMQHTYARHLEALEVRDAASLQAGTLESGVVKRSVGTAIGRVIERSSLLAGVRLDYATFDYDRLGRLKSLVRYLQPATAAGPVQWSMRLDSFGQALQLNEASNAPRFYRYSDWGEPVETRWVDSGVERRLTRVYDALGRLKSTAEMKDGVTDPETVNTYQYDTPVNVSPLVSPTFLAGQLARAVSPSGDVTYSYDVFGRVNAQVFRDNQNGLYIQQGEYFNDGQFSSLEFRLPDRNYTPEVAKYSYDSAGRLRQINFADSAGSRELYNAQLIDPLGRVLLARHGNSTVTHASYANAGRRLIQQVAVESALGSRRVIYGAFDALGREQTRREMKDGATDGPKTNVSYDALGRLWRAVQMDGATTLFNWEYKYDPLGNLTSLGDNVGSAGASLSYLPADPDSVCRIGYGNGGLGGNACNVVHDGMGNATDQPTRTGSRKLSYYASGEVHTITQGAAAATFHYDPFGAVAELDITGNGVSDARHDRHYGGLIERRDQVLNGNPTSFLARNIPGPDGVTASRRGSGDDWVFGFGEQRGNRYFTDQNGAFTQGVDFQPYGEAKSTGLSSGAKDYVNYQWNGGDTLAAFGLSQLGARVYDPVIGRFLNRDSLFLPRTASASNPYSFGFNDPLNHGDPTGLDSCSDDYLCISLNYSAVQDVEIAGALGAAWAAYDWIAGISRSHKPVLVDAGPVLRGVFDDAYRERYAEMSYVNRVANGPNIGEWAFTVYIGMPLKAALQAGCDLFACDNETGGGDTLVPDGHGGFRPDNYQPHRVSYARQAFNIAFNKVSGKATSAFFALEERVPAFEKAPTYCFSFGTKVLMADGSAKEIQDIQPGDVVMADDPERETEPAAHRVLQVHRNATYRLFHLKIGEGEIVTTGSHLFWTAHGWMPAEELTTTDVLRDDHAHAVAILAISVEDVDAPTFNLTVEGTHSFFVVAGGTPVLVHNEDPWDILFTQSDYGPTFTNGPWAGRTVEEAIIAARKLGRLPDGLTLEAIRLGDGRWAALNNRTLAVAQGANLPFVEPVDAGDAGMNQFNRQLRESGLSGPVEKATMRCR